MRKRSIIAGLALSASALVGLAVHEGYRGDAYMPTPNDRPTIGFGSTYNADGTPVKPGQSTDPVRALIRLNQHVDATQRRMRECIGDVPLHQHEWDAYVSLAYNIGTGAFCRSTLVKKLQQDPPDYEGACEEILRWNKQAGEVLPGLVKRRQAEYETCTGE